MANKHCKCFPGQKKKKWHLQVSLKIKHFPFALMFCHLFHRSMSLWTCGTFLRWMRNHSTFPLRHPSECTGWTQGMITVEILDVLGQELSQPHYKDQLFFRRVWWSYLLVGFIGFQAYLQKGGNSHQSTDLILKSSGFQTFSSTRHAFVWNKSHLD